MNKCPNCNKQVGFSKLFWQPAEMEFKCPHCGSFLRMSNSRRLVTIVIFLIFAAFIFHPEYGLRSLTDNLIILVAPLIVALFLIIFLQKFELVEKDFIIKNNDSGIEQTISKEDWEDIKRNNKTGNFTIIKNLSQDSKSNKP